MKPFAQNPARRSRSPRSGDCLVRECQAIRCNTRTKLSALRCTASSLGLVCAALLFTLLATVFTALPAIPTLEVPVEAWVKRNGVIVTNGGGGRDDAIAVVVDAHGDIIVTGSTSEPFNSLSEDILTIKYSGHDGSVVWSRRHDGGAGSRDFATGLAVDLEGNVVITGSSFTHESYPNRDSYIAKYAAADGAVLWEQRFRFPEENRFAPRMVTLDATGNAFVLGNSMYLDQTNSYVIKYAAEDGSLLWEKQLTNATVEAITVDSGGRVVLAGSSGDWDNVDQDWDNIDLYAAKVGAPDGALLWERRYDGKAHRRDWASAVAVDIEGNVIATGTSENSTDSDFYSAKYAAADGTLLWEKTYNGRARTNDVPMAVAVDTMGNVVVTGYSGNWANVQHYTAKYGAADGHLLWEQHYNGPTNDISIIYAVAVDAAGNVVVTGSCSSTNADSDYYTAKYASTDGALLWEHRYNGPANLSDSATALATDANGNVVVTGVSVVGQWNSDYYTAKYAAADGALLWEQRYDGELYSVAGGGSARAVAISPDGNVVVAGGTSDRFGDNPGSYTAKYSGADGTVIWQQRTNSYDARAMALDSSDNVVVTGCNSQPFQNEVCRTVKYAATDGAVLWELEQGGKALVVDQSGNVVVTGSRTVKYAAADGAVLWEQEQGGFAIAVDQSGNVVVTAGGFAAKYSAEDGALLWGSHSSVQSDTAAVVVDGNGNAVVTGRALQTPLSNWDYYTAKYAAADGSLLWEKYYNGPDNLDDAGTSVAVDSSDNVVVTGYSGLPCRGCFRAEIYTAKYAAADGALLWEQRYSGDRNKPGGAVAVDGNDNVVVTAFSSIGCGEPCGCFARPGDNYTAKYAAATGTLLWEQLYNNGDDSFSCFYPVDMHKILSSRILALGPDGSVVITGSSDGNPGPSTEYEMATVKYVMTQVTYPTPVVLSLALTSEGAHLRFTGDAGRTYRLQRASDPAGPWTTFSSLTAPPKGAVEHLDPAPLASPVFYRIAAP